MKTHFLQSDAWERFQQSLGRQTFRDRGEGWEYLAILEPARFGLSRLYCPYGPTADSPTALETALASLKTLGAKLGVVYLRLQPVGASLAAAATSPHLHPVTYSQPAHTWVIDLKQSEATLLQAMKPNTRNIYRNYHKKGLVHIISHDPQDITHLTTLLHEVADHNSIAVHSDAYFKAQAETLLPPGDAVLHLMTDPSDTVVAAALVYLNATTAYYAHAAASHAQRKLNPSTALLAEIIMDAKTQGKAYCDLYGVTDSDDPQHKWAGFTRFKQSFGGYQVDYNQTFEYGLKPTRYAALSAARRLRQLLPK